MEYDCVLCFRFQLLYRVSVASDGITTELIVKNLNGTSQLKIVKLA